MRTAATLFALVVLLVLSGCVSVQDRFDKADAFEANGRFVEAARSYATVIRRDPSFPEARERLAQVGTLAVERYLGAASVQADAGRYESALGLFRELDDLRALAADVDVLLPVPEGYAERRSRAETQAREQALARVDAAFAAGRYAEALRFADDAEATYRLAPADLDFVQRVRFGALSAQAEEAFAAGAFRSAFELAERAGPLAEQDADSERLRALQSDALAAGTRVVAFVPARAEGGEGRGRTGESDDAEALARALDDVLLYDYWTAPPLFVAPENPALVRDALRDLRLRRGTLTRREAAALGRSLGSDFVALVDVTEAVLTERVLRDEIRTAQTRRQRGAPAADTSYVFERVRLEAEVVVRVRVVEPVSREVIAEFSVEGEDDDRFDRARFEGDAATLQLSRDERRLFAPDRYREARADLLAAVVEDIAEDIALPAFDVVLDAIP